GLEVTAGKYKNPLHRTGENALNWDSDFNPEGVALTYRNGSFSAAAVAVWLDEVVNDDDSFLFGGQVGWKVPVLDGAELHAGLGYYHFVGFEGEPVFFDGNPRGNSVDVSGNYQFDYQNIEAFAELTVDIADRPVTLFADYVQNLEADKFDTGYALGARMQFMHRLHPWQLAYTYQDLEADAVPGIVTDSDFIGGGTDGSGHIFRGSYDLSDNISLEGTVFINERSGNLGIEEDYDRLQLDVSFKY
ncbi:MAG: putative porin, partial [Gammaproteobacteria bacterium]|nr:putative porin [Gammaproteobacteria bacterium]